MNNLIKYIDRITEFGQNPNVVIDFKVLELKKLLTGIYLEYLNLELEYDEKDYEEKSDFEYEFIRKNVVENFPELGWYHSVFECHNVIEKANLTTGDAIDDLTDIIKDLLEVRWGIENNSENDGIWHFEFLMKHHSEQHLVEFLKYLKDQNE